MKRLVFLCIVMVVAACNKDEIGPQQVDFESGESSSGQLMILCEGLFNFGTASISSYHPETGEVFQQQFSAANGGEPLGDILQSVLEVEDELWWVVNNSGKIEITDSALNSVQTITELQSPRYLAYSQGMVYATDFVSNSIAVIDPASYAVVDQIDAGDWSEEIFAFDNQLVYALPNEDMIVFDDLSNMSDDQQFLAGTYQDMTFTNNSLGPLAWCLSSENSSSNIIWNFMDGGVVNDQSFDSPMNHITGFGAWAAMAGDSLYRYTSPNVVQSFGNLDEVQTLYGFEWIPQMQRFAVADAVNYTSNGKVHFYLEDGTFEKTINVGALPNGFVWVD